MGGAVRRRVSLILNIWNMVWTNALAWAVEPPQQNDKVFLQNARRMEERLQIPHGARRPWKVCDEVRRQLL